jgi:hypothetical protein
MFLACPKSKVTIKLKFYYSNLKNAVETAKIAVDSCYVLRQFLTSLPLIDFREIRGLGYTPIYHNKPYGIYHNKHENLFLKRFLRTEIGRSLINLNLSILERHIVEN